MGRSRCHGALAFYVGDWQIGALAQGRYGDESPTSRHCGTTELRGLPAAVRTYNPLRGPWVYRFGYLHLFCCYYPYPVSLPVAVPLVNRQVGPVAGSPCCRPGSSCCCPGCSCCCCLPTTAAAISPALHHGCAQIWNRSGRHETSTFHERDVGPTCKSNASRSQRQHQAEQRWSRPQQHRNMNFVKNPNLLKAAQNSNWRSGMSTLPFESALLGITIPCRKSALRTRPSAAHFSRCHTASCSDFLHCFPYLASNRPLCSR